MKKFFDIVFSVVCCLVIVFGGFMSGISFGAIYEYNHLTANVEVEDYRVYTSDTLESPYFASDTYFCSVGWANNSSVVNFWDLPYTGNTLYYKTSFLVGDFVLSGQSYFGVGVSFYGSTDVPTYSAVRSGVGGVDSYSGFFCNEVSFNELIGSNTRGWGNSGYIRVRSSQNTSRYSLICYSIYAEDTSLTFDYVVSVEVGNYTNCPYSQIDYGNNDWLNSHINGTLGLYNWVSYYFGSGSRVTFYIPTFANSSNSYENSTLNYYSYRKYFTIRQFTDNDFYQQGFYEGTQSGYSDGEQYGYDRGYDYGYQQGDSAGYNRALMDDHYTFLNFLGAVVDAPIQAFRGLFNIEVLGVNLADFLSALLTIAVVLLVAKFVFLH